MCSLNIPFKISWPGICFSGNFLLFLRTHNYVQFPQITILKTLQKNRHHFTGHKGREQSWNIFIYDIQHMYQWDEHVTRMDAESLIKFHGTIYLPEVDLQNVCKEYGTA